MAETIFPGAGAESLSTYPYRITDNHIQIPEFVEIYFDYNDSDRSQSYLSEGGLPLTGALLRNDYAPAPAAHYGQVAHSFSVDYYNRVHIRPSPMDFGSLVQETTLQFEVWNAFFESTTLTDTLKFNFDGLSIEDGTVPPPDVVLEPLQNSISSVTANPDGPAVIDATVQILAATTTVPKPVPDLEITGRRGKLLPFVSNWQKDPIERLSWKTNIVETDEWDERRYRLRQWPRRGFQMGMGAIGAGADDLKAAAISAQNADYAFPLWMYEGQLSETSTAGETELHVTTADNDFQDGGSALIFESPARSAIVRIESVSENLLTLPVDNPLSATWYKGTNIYPVRTSRIDSNIALDAMTGDAITLTLNVENTEQSKVFSEHGFPGYLGYPLLDWIPNWRSNRKFAYQRKISTIDTGIHPKKYINHSERYGETQEFEWFLNGRMAVQRFKGLMQYLAGRHKELWVPSWHHEFPMVGTYSSGDYVIEVNGNFGSKMLLSNVSNPTHARLRTKDGRNYCDRVISAQASVGNAGNDVLRIENGWAADIGKYWVDDFSLLTLVRLDTDSISITWKTPQMAIAKTTFRYVPEQPG